VSEKKIRAALYLRVRTDGQTTDNQRLALEAVAQQRGWNLVGIYDDDGISGAKTTNARPALARLLKDAARGKVDLIATWAIDRLGRSLADLLDTLRTLETAGVDLFIHEQGVDTSSPSGRLFFSIVGAFAEFEREMIRSRVKAGLERARSRGVKLGRRPVPVKVEAAIRSRLAEGTGMLKVARELGVGTSVVQRIRREMDLGGNLPERGRDAH
jgi:DNA invertase Pin-like site-specific DNA recombinase